MKKLPILYEPQDKLDGSPAVSKRISKSDESPTRHLGDFRNTVTKDYVTQVSVKLGWETVGGTP